MAASTSSSDQMRRRYTVHEVLAILEDEDNMITGDVYIAPPGNGAASDEDSGHEDEGTFQNLNPQQLLADAEGVALYPGGEAVRVDFAEDLFDDQPEIQPHQHVAPDNVAADNDPVQQEEPQAINQAPHPPAQQQPAPGAPRQLQAAQIVRNRVRLNQVNRDWRRQDLPQNRLPTQQPWPNVPPPRFLEQNLSPRDNFELFFDDDVIDYLTDQTQLYASRDKGDHVFQTNRQDMRTFLAILLVSGYNPLPRRRMFWERSTDVRNEAVCNAMTRTRFEDHLKYLHLSDNMHNDPNDKLAKVRNFLVLINERCLQHYPVSRCLCVDESMVPYFGHHSCKQFIRGKPIRFGYKLWCLADPLGYVVQFEPYLGAGQGLGPLGLGGSVVMDLVSELPEYPFHLTFDNFFTLLSELATRGIGATGTIRRNRIQHCPLIDAGAFARRPRGSTDFCLDRTENILILQWNDNNVVTMASNCYAAQPFGNARRWSKRERQFIQIDQPNLNRTYNASMGGVDRADQNINTYRMRIRTKKWWWPFFAHTVELALQNAWLLYRKSAPADALDLLGFRRSIAQFYLRVALLPAARPVQAGVHFGRVPDHVRLDMTQHFSGDANVQKRCALCRRNTKKICQKCGVGLHLHCFNQFHGVP